jgi:N-acetylated-alpha-linked acidic dipeptidase
LWLSLTGVVKLVTSPNQTVPGQSVYEAWDKQIDTMGSGSDFTAFQDFAGIPSLDMGFNNDGKSSVYHYHSNYDSFDWMERYGDPSFQHHATIAKLWALTAAKLVETPVIQMNATEYSIGLDKYIDSVEKKAKEANYSGEEEDLLAPLYQAATHFRFAATIHDATAAQLLLEYYNNDIPWWKPWEKVKLYLAIRAINTKYKFLERKFLYPEGLDERPWFKHVVFAPGKWTGYAGATFPGIVEGIDEKKDDTVKKWIDISSKAIDAAADWLEE